MSGDWGSMDEITAQVETVDGALVDADHDGDLDLILLKALRKEPQRRYASAEQLADDIRRHLERLCERHRDPPLVELREGESKGSNDREP